MKANLFFIILMAVATIAAAQRDSVTFEKVILEKDVTFGVSDGRSYNEVTTIIYTPECITVNAEHFDVQKTETFYPKSGTIVKVIQLTTPNGIFTLFYSVWNIEEVVLTAYPLSDKSRIRFHN